MKHQDLIARYGLNEPELHTLYKSIVSFLNEKGVKVSFTNLEGIVETDIYKMERAVKPEDKHHESCISDGMEVWQHEDMEDIGGICGRLYDILHVGCGHLYQWSANGTSGLQFAGENAWKVGSTFYLKRPEEEIKLVYKYEQEAGILALANLKLILKKYNFSKEFSEKVILLFNDYLQTDLEYITSFYRTAAVENFFDKWQFNATALPEVEINFPLNIVRRTNKCVALIGAR